MNYQTATGRRIRVSDKQPLGSGGEGQVLPVVGAGDLAAKIYKQPRRDRLEKLEVMLANPIPRLNGHSWVAWPSDILFTCGRKGTFRGFLMPKVKGARPIFNYYNHGIRSTIIPGFHYRYLVRCGRNLAAAVASAHRRGYVVADLNESNVFVHADARVTLIDCDSWQVVDPARGTRYRFPLVTPGFLAPELRGIDLATIDRQPWHDAFSLAVLIFKVLCEGTHPFDAVYHGNGDPPPLEARSVSGRLPCLDNSGLWTPKPTAVPFNTLHPRLQQLFVRAFEIGYADPRSRPDAREFQQALTEAERELRTCSRNSSHRYWLDPCEWCRRAQLLAGLDPFPESNGRRGRAVIQQAPAAHPTHRRIQAAMPWLSQLLAWAANNPSSFFDQINALDKAIAAAYRRDWALFGRDRLRGSGALLLTTSALLAGVACLATMRIGWLGRRFFNR